MSKKNKQPAGAAGLPSSDQIEKELARVKYSKRYRRTVRDIVFTLITVAALAILISTQLLPVFRIYGTSMTPTLTEGEMVVAVKTENLSQGDLIAFYYNNKILVKRVIATSGEWVDIDSDGNVTINGEPLDEPYVSEKSLGQCNIDLPYQVPDGRVFVMGDHREVSVDSRMSAIGCVAQEQIAGRLVFRIWPLQRIGRL